MKRIATGLLLALYSVVACASEAFPVRTMKMVVPWGSGGATDNLARLFADEMQKRLGQPVIVENVPGASGGVGATRVARSKPDGYTLMFTTNALVINEAFSDGKQLSVQRDLLPLALVGYVANMLLVPGDSEYKSVAEYVASAKADPGGLSYASSGPGTSTRLGVMSFENLTQTKLLGVTYPSSSAMIQALLGKHVKSTWLSGATITSLLETGKIRSLGSASEKRSRFAPNVLTFKEQGLDFTSETWFGILMPKNGSVEISQRLNSVVSDILSDPIAKKRLMDANVETLGAPKSIAQLEKEISSELASYKALISKSTVDNDK